MSRKLLIYFGLLIILTIGSWLRFSGIISNSFAFTYDVGRDMLAVKSIILDHKFSLIGQTTGIEGIFYGPWWYLILSIPFFLFSGNPQGIAFFMGIIGIITIILSFLVGKKIGGAFLGIVFSAFISVSSLMVYSSTQIWNPNLIPFLCVLVLLTVYELFIDNKRGIYRSRNFLLLGLLLGIVMDMEIVFGILFFVSIFVSLIFMFKKKLLTVKLSLAMFGLLFIFSPRIVFDIRHNFLMFRKAIGFFSSDFLPSEPISFFGVFLNRLEALFNLWRDTLAGQNSLVGFILILFFLLCLFMFYKKIDDIQKQFIKTILIIFGVFLVGLTFFSHDIWPHYIVGIPIFYILLLAIAINSVKTKFKKTWGVIFLLFVLFWINLNPTRVLDNIKKPLWEGNAAVYRNQLAVVDYVYSDAKGKNFKYILYTPAVHDYNYKYLFSWYGKKKYGYIPSEKSSLFYVIIEPDYDLPFRLKDWLKLREKDGVIQKEKAVKGGVTVQTRSMGNEQ